MRPEHNSRRLFGITRSKGKMYELGLPETSHIAVPPSSEPQELFILTVGTLGDAAAKLNEAENVDNPLSPAETDELGFSASFFDAFLESRFSEAIAHDVTILAASAYYLGHRPGSSLVLARKIANQAEDLAVDKLLQWILQAQWTEYPSMQHPIFGHNLEQVAKLISYHFHDGSSLGELKSLLNKLKHSAYGIASARDLLFIDIISAITQMRLAASSWTTLPRFTQIAAENWALVIQRPEFPKELWPSQILIGKAGLFLGASGVIQMPTSAGKTRSIEIVIRSGFLSGRTKLAVIVAPFRALCHEIGTSLRHAFREDDIKVNELSDALQLDFLNQISELLGSVMPSSQYVLILTPEKLLYVLRHTPSIIHNIGIVVYDEGHQFDSGSRGITYELLLTEIKSMLPPSAQTILVSAVIQNANAIGQWLMGEDAQIVNGSNLLPTARSVAFASWIERLGQLMFFESDSYANADYFVPRVIEQQKFEKRPRERNDRYFPEKDSSNDVSLYLGIRLISQGAVAIFCGRKDTASGMAARAVEIYGRGFSLPAPATFANPEELRRLKFLIDCHFGNESIVSRAASLGIFVHHSNTPHGMRLAIEHAMQKGLTNFVACTSTLAQGVNLPIRYLIVSGIYQAGEKIKARDFQNLVGRAGRAGMHTEGLVIFSDPFVYDRRLAEPWMFNSSIELLSNDIQNSATSSLLELIAPFQSRRGSTLHIPADELCKLMLSEEQSWIAWSNEVVRLNPIHDFVAKDLIAEFRYRRRLINAIESYLMANRGTHSVDEFKAKSEQIAAATLAYHLASDEEKFALIVLFISVAEYVQNQVQDSAKQIAYSKTLLGAKAAKEIEQWVIENNLSLLSLETNKEWLQVVWPLFTKLSDDKFFHTIEPTTLPIELASLWLEGKPYLALFEHAKSAKGSKAWGERMRRQITEDDIIDLCESTLGFECSLVLAAVSQFMFGENVVHNEAAAALMLFQKSLKYGLPDWLAITCYEHGFSDRVVAQHLRETLRTAGFTGNYLAPAILPYRQQIAEVLSDYPSYFETVLTTWLKGS